MRAHIVSIMLAVALASLLIGCASPAEEAPPMDTVREPGLYDLEGDAVEAVGTVSWIDLEGGFWAITDEAGTNVAVIANGDELHDELSALEGEDVSVTGERFEGMSIRMAGPEIVAESIESLE